MSNRHTPSVFIPLSHSLQLIFVLILTRLLGLSMDHEVKSCKLKENIIQYPTLWEPSTAWHCTETDLFVLQTCLPGPIFYRKSQIIWSQTNCQLLVMVGKPDINQSVFIRATLRFSVVLILSSDPVVALTSEA